MLWCSLSVDKQTFPQQLQQMQLMQQNPQMMQDPKAQQQIDDYTAEAVRLLEEALQLAGPALAAQVRSQMAADRALDAIRNKPAFKRLTATPSNK